MGMTNAPPGAIPLPPAGAAVPEGALALPPKGKPIDESVAGRLTGAVADTFGLSGRPGSKTAQQVILNPEGALEHGISMAVKVPAYTAAGPWGSVALAGAEGAAAAAQRGEGVSSMAGHGVADVALAALTKGALGGASKALRPVAQSSAATREIREGLGWAKGKFFDKLVKDVAGKDLPGERGRAVEHAVSELNRLKSGVGDDFRAYVEGAKVTGAASSVADALRRFVSSEGARGLAQAGATEQVVPGLPAGALAAKELAEHVPYLGRAVHAAEQMTE